MSGSLKRSLGMASGRMTIPKALSFEPATQWVSYKKTLWNLLQ
jgi:hypothetical protein